MGLAHRILLVLEERALSQGFPPRHDCLLSARGVTRKPDVWRNIGASVTGNTTGATRQRTRISSGQASAIRNDGVWESTRLHFRSRADLTQALRRVCAIADIALLREPVMYSFHREMEDVGTHR